MNKSRSKSQKASATITFLWVVWCLLLYPSGMTAQQDKPVERKEGSFIVTGQVRDACTHQPIAAAQIQALNNPASATTNQEGNFTIKLYREDEVLSVSAFDYNTRELALRGNKTIIIDMYPEVFSDRVTWIDMPLGKVRNSILVPSVKSIQDLSKAQAVTADELINSSLNGDVRSINRSGFPGMGSVAFIRGYNSLLSNALPLYVIDGVMVNGLYDIESIFKGNYQNPLLNIDVNDIESITVLKDGTSLYGTKGSNGVILIKTNRGKSQATKINLNLMYSSIDQPKQLPVMNADQYRIYASEILGSAGYSKNEIANLNFLNTDKTYLLYNKFHNQTNWADEVYNQGNLQSYSINVNGGDEKALYYISLGYTGHKGVVKTTGFDRINTRVNADINLMKNVAIGLNVSYTNMNNVRMDDGVDFYASPTYLSMIKSPFMSPYSYTSSGKRMSDYDTYDELGIGNPLALIDNSYNYTRSHYFDMSLTPEWKITPFLTFTTQFDYNLNKFEENYFRPMKGVVPEYVEGYGYSYNRIKNQIVRNIAIYSDSRIKYNRLFNLTHHINAYAGWRYVNNYLELDYTEGHNTGSDNNTRLQSSYDYLKVNGVNDLTLSISNYAGIDYDYAGRYFLSAVLSLDGSSRFGKKADGGLNLFGTTWAVMPSMNLAWLVSSEPFMKHISFINQLKLRAGYGLTGNDDIEDYATKAYFQTVRYLGYGNGIVLSNLANNKLKWETTGRLNTGIDLGLFNERLNLSFDVYSSRTKDLLIWKSLNDLAGLDAYLTNAGTLSNKGYEASINLRALNLKDVQWELGAAIGHYKNRIESLPAGDIETDVYDGTVLTTVGQPAGVFYGFKTKGIFSTEDEAANAHLAIRNLNGSLSYFKAGDVFFEDFYPDGIIDNKDRQLIGDPNPDFYGSITSSLTIKKWTLNTLFTYNYGNDIYNYLRSQLESGKDFSNQTTAMLNRWRSEGQLTNQPKAVFNDPMGNARFSDRWIEDGSYIRLKTVSLSYHLPIKSSFISGLDIWLAANNLWTMTNYLGSDPEFSARNAVLYQGVDAGLLPQTKSYFMGVKINL